MSDNQMDLDSQCLRLKYGSLILVFRWSCWLFFFLGVGGGVPKYWYLSRFTTSAQAILLPFFQRYLNSVIKGQKRNFALSGSSVIHWQCCADGRGTGDPGMEPILRARQTWPGFVTEKWLKTWLPSLPEVTRGTGQMVLCQFNIQQQLLLTFCVH